MRFSKSFRNAISINFKNLITSSSVKLIIIIVFMISSTFSFWPFIRSTLFGNKKIETLDISENYLLVLAICSVLMLFTVLLVTRIGAQVGFQKGSKVTELILTSITRTQLFASHIISSFVVAIISITIIYLPLVIALLINDSSIGITVGEIKFDNWVFMFLHMLGVCLVLIVLAVTITSKVKRSEDTGPYLLLVLFPFILSHFYFAIYNNIYQGVLFFLNFIPLFSLIPVIGVSVNGRLHSILKILMLQSDFIFIVLSCIWGAEVFNKNITTR